MAGDRGLEDVQEEVAAEEEAAEQEAARQGQKLLEQCRLDLGPCRDCGRGVAETGGWVQSLAPHPGSRGGRSGRREAKW